MSGRRRGGWRTRRQSADEAEAVRDFSRARRALHEAADLVRSVPTGEPQSVPAQAARSVRVVSADVPTSRHRPRQSAPPSRRADGPAVMPDVSLPRQRPTLKTTMPDPPWLAELATIGAALGEARVERGESLDDVHRATLVPLLHLRAIEEGDRAALPPAIYLESFLRRYADHVVRPDLLPEEHRSVPEVVLRGAGRHRFRRAVVALVLLAGLAAAAVALTGGDDDGATPTATTAAPSATTAAPASDPPPAPAAPEAPAPPPPVLVEETATGARWSVSPGPADLTVMATGETWARVVIDGVTVFEGTLAPGHNGTWPVAGEASVRIGNPPGAQVALGGHPLPVPQQAGPWDLLVAVTPPA